MRRAPRSAKGGATFLKRTYERRYENATVTQRRRGERVRRTWLPGLALSAKIEVEIAAASAEAAGIGGELASTRCTWFDPTAP